MLPQPCLESVPPDPLHRADPNNGGRLLPGDELLPGASADPHCRDHVRDCHKLILCALSHVPQILVSDTVYCGRKHTTTEGKQEGRTERKANER